MTKLIDGKRIALDIRAEIKTVVAKLREEEIIPCLSVVLVGEDPASQIYVRSKARTAGELGIKSDTICLPKETAEHELLALIEKLNNDESVNAILIQLPLPAQIDEGTILNAVSPEKDVDGFHSINRGKLLIGEDTFIPCTPAGVQEMLIRSDIEIPGKHVVIVGRSKIVGLPLTTMFVQKHKHANATVTVCHTGTADLTSITLQADILIAAIGKPEAIKGNMVKKGAVVIDVGINRVDDASSEKGYKLVGDVEFEEVSQHASAISPVPGGVGPMTIAMLMKNTVKAAQKQCASSSTG